MLFLLSCTFSDSNTFASQLRPTWTPETLQESLDEILSYGFPDGNDFWDLYRTLYDEGATPSCPGTEYNFDGNELTSYECYTADGFQFEGLSEFMYELGGWRLHLEGKILAPDGRIVHGAGSVSLEEQEATRKTFEGTLYANSGASWLKESPSLLFHIEKFDNFRSLEGGYTISGKSISFEHFQLGRCPFGEGVLLLREPQGGWWRYESSTHCLEEGNVSFNGEDMGTISLDFSELEQELVRVLP
jgi:hypothetical protein